MIEIAQIQLAGDDDDGLTFDLSTVTAESIREENEYSGVRVSLGPTCDRCRALSYRRQRGRSHLAGTWRSPLPKLLGGEIRLLGYPMTMVLAEKAVTALQRSTANTRWRDFGDVYQLTGRIRTRPRSWHAAPSRRWLAIASRAHPAPAGARGVR